MFRICKQRSGKRLSKQTNKLLPKSKKIQIPKPTLHIIFQIPIRQKPNQKNAKRIHNISPTNTRLHTIQKIGKRAPKRTLFPLVRR